MKPSFFSTFFVVYIINDFLLTSIGLYLLVCRNTWLGVTCFILGQCGLAMAGVLIKKTVLTNWEENESGDITSFTIDAK